MFNLINYFILLFTETHALAKNKILNFCYTSSTEIEGTENRRKHIKRKRFNSYSSDEDLNNDSRKEKQILNTYLSNFFFIVLQILPIVKYFNWFYIFR